MKVLTSTKLTQKQRDNDFNFCEDGELVSYPSACDSDGRDPDGFCGCSRSWTSVSSGSGTTTAIVTDSTLSREEYIELIVSYYVKAYGEAYARDARKEAVALLRAASEHPVGTVLEYRRGRILARDLSTPLGGLK